LHLLYVDDSGSPTNPEDEVFVLGGFSIFERQAYWLEKRIDNIAARFDPAEPRSIELHGSPMHNGRNFWRSIPFADRQQAVLDALATASSHDSVRMFIVVVDLKTCTEDPVAIAFEHLCSRFDRLLVDLYKRGDPQRGLMLFDKHSSENTVQKLARDFREIGHRWGALKNMADVPVFLDSRASRLIQVADLIAFATKRYFANDDQRFFPTIEPRIYREGRNIAGLALLPEQESPLFAPHLTRVSVTSIITTTAVVMEQVATDDGNGP